MIDNKRLIEIIEAIGKKIIEEKDYLTDLDNPIGDSDHGINMARGFTEVGKKLSTLENSDIGATLKTVGMTLVSTVGGASGPLYGTAFMKAGMVLAGKNEMCFGDFLAAMDAAVEGVKMRGKSDVEEKTMLDAMVPALKAMKDLSAAGHDAGASLKAGVEAAGRGVEHTKEIIATKGRASYLGERSLGHQDPGATSFTYMLQVIEENV